MIDIGAWNQFRAEAIAGAIEYHRTHPNSFLNQAYAKAGDIFAMPSIDPAKDTLDKMRASGRPIVTDEEGFILGAGGTRTEIQVCPDCRRLESEGHSPICSNYPAAVTGFAGLKEEGKPCCSRCLYSDCVNADRKLESDPFVDCARRPLQTRDPNHQMSPFDKLLGNVKATLAHWREFGADHGFDEDIDRLERVVGEIDPNWGAVFAPKGPLAVNLANEAVSIARRFGDDDEIVLIVALKPAGMNSFSPKVSIGTSQDPALIDMQIRLMVDAVVKWRDNQMPTILDPHHAKQIEGAGENDARGRPRPGIRGEGRNPAERGNGVRSRGPGETEGSY